MDPTIYDKKLVEMRQCVDKTISEILLFTFESNDERKGRQDDDDDQQRPMTQRGTSVISDADVR